MASYKRPLSASELRNIRRQRSRLVLGGLVVVSIALAILIGLLYLLNRTPTH